MNQPQQFSLPFVKKEQVNKDTYTFYFDRTHFNYQFIAGQYNTVILPHENPDARGIRRFFSVSTSPNNKEFITITTKISQSTFKNKLMNLTTGEEITFEGPRGHFILKELDSRYVFLVGGIGITPLMSILRFADEEKLHTDITLFASFSTYEDMILYDEFKDIEQRNPNIKVIYTLTHPEEQSSWIGETGRISKEMIHKYVADVLKPYYYIVGPSAMVDGMIEIVKELEVPQEKIVKENFTGY